MRALAAESPDYVVLPEKVFAGGAVSLDPLMSAAAHLNATLIAGFDETLDDGRRVNSARVITAEGGETLYAKRRLIPGLETGYAIGEGPLVIGAHGVAICKDYDFAPMIRGYGERGVQLMFAPAWDFVSDGKLHARMAVVRGVENGFALARAAANGRLTLSDRYGRIVREAVTDPARPVSLVVGPGAARRRRHLCACRRCVRVVRDGVGVWPRRGVGGPQNLALTCSHSHNAHDREIVRLTAPACIGLKLSEDLCVLISGARQ